MHRIPLSIAAIAGDRRPIPLTVGFRVDRIRERLHPRDIGSGPNGDPHGRWDHDAPPLAHIIDEGDAATRYTDIPTAPNPD